MVNGDTLAKISDSDQWIYDSAGNMIGAKNPRAVGGDLRATGAGVVLPVTASRALTSDDIDNILSITNGLTLTLGTDKDMKIANPNAAATIGLLPLGASYTLDVSAVTMLNSAPTITQGKITGITHVGLNTWAYIG